LDKKEINEDEELKIIEAGAEDIVNDEEIKIITSIDDLEKVKNQLQEFGFDVKTSDMIYLAKDKVEAKDEEKLLGLLDALDDDDDINNIYTNANI
jgi:transcriptional/translational regulatory protein YebC/TACO1